MKAGGVSLSEPMVRPRYKVSGMVATFFMSRLGEFTARDEEIQVNCDFADFRSTKIIRKN